VLAAVVAVVALGCTVPSRLPDGSVPQIPPIGLNGLAEEAGSSGRLVWGADYFGHQLLRFDPDTGRIDERFGGLCSTDDLVVAPDSSLVATCPDEGTVVRIDRDGTLHLLALIGIGVNAIALEPGGASVVVGFGNQNDDRLFRVPLDGTPVQVVADGLPVLNGFGFGPDGLLYVPTGGALGVLGSTGGLASIDMSTGTVREIPLHFDDPSRKGLAFAAGVEVGTDGTVYMVQSVDAAVYAVDPLTGDTRLVGRSPLPTADNLVVMSDGRIVVSGFLGGGVVTFTPDASGGWSRSFANVGG